MTECFVSARLHGNPILQCVNQECVWSVCSCASFMHTSLLHVCSAHSQKDVMWLNIKGSKGRGSHQDSDVSAIMPLSCQDSMIIEEAHNPNKQVNTPPTQQPLAASPLLVLLLPSRLRRNFTSLPSVCLLSFLWSMCRLPETSGISCPLASVKSASGSNVCDVLLCFLCPTVVHSSIFDQLTYTLITFSSKGVLAAHAWLKSSIQTFPSVPRTCNYCDHCKSYLNKFAPSKMRQNFWIPTWIKDKHGGARRLFTSSVTISQMALDHERQVFNIKHNHLNKTNDFIPSWINTFKKISTAKKNTFLKV